MGIRVVQVSGGGGGGERSCAHQPPPPHAAAEKPFLLSDGKLELEASLDKAVYSHGQPIRVNVALHNNSNKTVRKMKVNDKNKNIKISLFFIITKEYEKQYCFPF